MTLTEYEKLFAVINQVLPIDVVSRGATAALNVVKAVEDAGYQILTPEEAGNEL